MNNPFHGSESPIQQLYQRSRSKSQQNRFSTRSRSTSYRQFQVGIIQQALKRNHIINKQYQGQQKKSIQRERQQSKYFGIDSQRYHSPLLPGSRDNVRSVYYQPQKENQPTKSVRFQKCDDSYLQTMVNLGENRSNPYSKKRMQYESNYFVANTSELSVPAQSSNKIISSKKLQNSKSKKQNDRKCSITLKLSEQELPFDKLRRLQEAASKKKIDSIREEYFQDQNQQSKKDAVNSQGRVKVRR